MDNKEFNKLFNKKEYGLLLLDGGVNLTKQQLKKLKEAGKKETDERVQRMAMKLANEPGYRDSVLLPLKKQLMDQFAQMIVNVGKESAKQAENTKVEDTVVAPAKPKPAKVPRTLKAESTNMVGKKNLTDPEEILGEIFKMMKIMDEDRKLNQEMVNSHLEEEEHRKEKRNREIIKALTGRKKPKVKKPKVKKKEEPTKPSEKPPEGKAPEGKAPETPRPEAPKVEQPKVETPKVEPPKVEVPKVETPKVGAKPAILETAKRIGTVAVLGAIAGGGILAGREALAANISKYESDAAGGYNAYNRGTFFFTQKGEGSRNKKNAIDFSKMTITDYLNRTAKTDNFPQGKLKVNDPNVLFAIGRYQIIPSTMLELIKKLKLDPDKTFLDKDTQDALFVNGLLKNTRTSVEKYLTGKSNDRDAAILALAQEFASIGVPYDMTLENGKKLKRGDSYYGGGNVAHNSPDAVGQALDIDRAKNIKPENVNQTVPNEQSDKIYGLSNSIAEGKKDLNAQSQASSSSTTVVNNTNQTTPSSSGPQVNDMSAAYNKSKEVKK
jgi:hypothetical protein